MSLNGASHHDTSHHDTSDHDTSVSLTSSLSGPAVAGGEHTPPTDIEQELLSLEAELSATTAKAAATRARIAARELEVRAALRAELDAARVVLAEFERQHELTVAMIEETTRVQVSRILIDARRVAADQRSGAFDNDE